MTAYEQYDRIQTLEQSRTFVQSILLAAMEGCDEDIQREFSEKLKHIDDELESLMQPSYSLYYLRINQRIYMSQNVTDITGFAILYGVLGCVEDMGLVNWSFQGIKCIEQ